ncbi:hypothetical protein N836_09500 [Leptolyngbya sp. Heron Island J]|uniref:hypothetical protein n=1 Tax=Leptolyngbya sp. Heron Island J TaxID=1385935 RepID=UPI0003B9E92D|nr:hypothetical protein [Leptolyngbya sp. Heron Island J]ESA35944.1 hypothetical protein N836_09500 [Leptolyngbya sp. Heron Island J]
MNLNYKQDQRFSSQDPLEDFLTGTLKLSSAKIGFVIFLFTLIIYSHLIFLSGELRADHFFSLVFRCVLFPLLPLAYLWSGKALFELLSNLAKDKTLKVSEKEFKFAELHYKKIRKLRYFGSILFSFLYSFFFGIYIFSPNIFIWSNVNGLIKLFAIGMNALFCYMGFSLFVTLLLNVKLLRHFFSYKTLKVQLFYPGKYSGLSSLSRYTLHSAYALTVVGSFVGLTEFTLITEAIQNVSSSTEVSWISEVFPIQFVETSDVRIWITHFQMILYFAVSPIIFFGPLLTTHQEMVEAKEKVLKDISEQFQHDYSKLKFILKEDGETLRNQIERFDQLDALYSRVDKFHVWPFDIQTLRKYALSLSAPLIPSITTALLDIFQATITKVFS